LNLLVGTFLTTATLILSTGVKDKVAISSLVHALHHPSVSSALALLDLVSLLDVVVVVVLLTAVPITASGSTLVTLMIAIMKMLSHTLDSPPSKTSEDLPKPSASLVPSTPRAPDLKPVSASSTLAVDLVAALNLPST